MCLLTQQHTLIGLLLFEMFCAMEPVVRETDRQTDMVSAPVKVGLTNSGGYCRYTKLIGCIVTVPEGTHVGNCEQGHIRGTK